MTIPPSRDVADWRQEYQDRGLTEAELGPDPITAFESWLGDAIATGIHEPNAMVVASIGTDGAAARMVLLKGIDQRGFVFYTNYHSRKATELAADPACALLFPWHPLERQVRVEGRAEQVSPAESDAYFATRPRPAQIGAWASPQSEVVASREYLEDRYAEATARFADHEQIPRPPFWGGILVRPHRIEFWQGRPGRLHDRLRFDRALDGSWSLVRLAP